MDSIIRSQVDRCIEELKRGTLTEADLNWIVKVAEERRTLQDILYLHVAANSLIAEVFAMRIVTSGEIWDGPENPDDWPYQSALEAVRDGWRVIKFPELALTMDESRTYGLGFEFVLDRNGGLG